MARPKSLDEGDRITYSVSAQVFTGVRMTVRVSVSGRVRQGESANAASKRIESFVHNRMSEKIAELTKESGRS